MTKLPIQLGRVTILCVTLFFAANALIAYAQNADAAADLAARVNRERVTRGLAPLALNAKLTAAAQAHAEDIARNSRTSSAQEGHVGSDGSSVFDRVARTGYGAYSWGRRLGENWAWYQRVADALALWMDSAPHRANILHPLYREMGIGVALAAKGGFVYVIDFGSQPSVLPVFVNDDANETKSHEVKITLTSEEVAPNGDGEYIGRPIQIQIANTADFAGANWQPVAPTINWTLAANGATKTVYVKYRDAKGRMAIASDSIVFGATQPPITLTRAPSTRTPTRATPQPSVSAASAPTERAPMTSTVAAAEIAPAVTPALATVELSATETALPTREATPFNPVENEKEMRFDGLGMAVVAVMSIVLLRVWFVANR
jgi:uncharacterized protein YkwD